MDQTTDSIGHILTDHEILDIIFNNPKNSTLYDNLPSGYGEKGRNDEVDLLLQTKVLRMHSDHSDHNDVADYRTYPKSWPGNDIGITRWYELENGKAVGWQFVVIDEKLHPGIQSEVFWKFIVRDL